MVGKQKLVDVEWRSSGTYLAACFERNLNLKSSAIFLLQTESVAVETFIL